MPLNYPLSIGHLISAVAVISVSAEMIDGQSLCSTVVVTAPSSGTQPTRCASLLVCCVERVHQMARHASWKAAAKLCVTESQWLNNGDKLPVFQDNSDCRLNFIGMAAESEKAGCLVAGEEPELRSKESVGARDDFVVFEFVCQTRSITENDPGTAACDENEEDLACEMYSIIRTAISNTGLATDIFDGQVALRRNRLEPFHAYFFFRNGEAASVLSKQLLTIRSDDSDEVQQRTIVRYRISPDHVPQGILGNFYDFMGWKRQSLIRHDVGPVAQCDSAEDST
ncbi:hypothetical protein SAICODRAFT_30459 [Saitoella complicata NRRL Y-17804]|nr:uncharacterized protein SAICODRAFT_30459 [Saitoella complicata NRRL Y-17804]ODQ53066.1 hypothetical protein SAICODRAFT_30459 [Saitoella complicata NRRL Y-17804]